MSKKNPYPGEFERLRRRAENIISNGDDYRPWEPADSENLFLELQIHHEELEVQNEELRRTQAELESCLANYVSRFYDLSPFGYVAVSPKGIIKEINLTGAGFLNSYRINLKFAAFSNFIDVPCQMNYFFALKQAARTGQRQSVEFKLNGPAKDGTWVLASIQADLDDSKQTRQWLIAFMDISDVKQEQARLEQSNEGYNRLFETLPLACHLMDCEGNIVSVNSCWRKMTGCDKLRARGKKITGLIHPDWRNSFNHSISKSLLNNAKCHIRLPIMKEDGSHAHMDCGVLPCSDGKTKYIYCYFQPIHKLQSRDTHNPGALPGSCPCPEDLPGSFMQLDTKGQILFANRACHARLGYERGRLKGLFQWDLASDPEEVKRIRTWFRYKIKYHPQPEPMLAKFNPQGSKEIYFQLDWDYHCDDRGRTKGIWVQLTDVPKAVPEQYSLINDLIRAKEKMIGLKQELEKREEMIEFQLSKKRENKNEFREMMAESMKTFVFPYIKRLKNSPLKKEQHNLLNTIESNLNEILDPFLARPMVLDRLFTPMEMKIAHLIMGGRTNKEIAPLLSISDRTVAFHRENIRKKLSIKNKGINLRSELISRYK